MRLIDADALIEKKWQAENESCFYALDDVVSVDDINDAPTIEPKRGEWIDREQCQIDEDGYDVAICSNCKEEITIDPRHDNFCPNCGADMREREGE